MARYALGLVLKKSDPDRALALFDEAARLAGGRAQLLVGGHRADGGGRHPGRARRPGRGRARVRRRARPLGPRRRRTQQWLNLRYVVRLLDPARRRVRRRRAAPLPGRRGQAVPARPAGRAAAARRRPDGVEEPVGLRPRLPRTAVGSRQSSREVSAAGEVAPGPHWGC